MLRLALALLCLLALPAAAQDRATLVADRVEIAGGDRLVAAGAVEVFFEGRRLRASRITYDRGADRLIIDGPITLTDGAGTVILADQADLAADLSEGILTSARMVLEEQLQLASAEILRVGGRYTRLGRTVASSCKVCAGNPTPLWEIRARRVVHDQSERQLYFDNAQLRVGGLPVFWLPRLRMPDPTLDRATGFLMPSLRTTSELGTGLRLPYFITLGPHKDLTITPYFSSRGGRTVDLRYRQAFATGAIAFSGALTRDEILPGETRGYVLATGAFRLPRNFRLDLRLEDVSDRGYSLDYGRGERDRVMSRIEATRVSRGEWVSARLLHIRTLRDGEDNSRLPSLVADLTWQRRLEPALIGGLATLTFRTHSHSRTSSVATDSDGDGISDGRDTGRATAMAAWRRDMILGPGVQLAALGEVRADWYEIGQDAAAGGSFTRVTGAAGVELRWPLTRATARGATQVIEPVVQLVWATDNSAAVPNEDSVLAEFDEGNLFALHRLPGNDAVERGARANVGIGLTHIDPGGWSLGLTFGRVLRDRPSEVFSAASGLDGGTSDWLAALRWQAPGITLTNRFVLDDDLRLTKGEARLDLVRDRFAVAGSFVWMKADASEQRTAPVRELLLDASYDFTGNWTGQFATRYDFVADRAASAGVKFAYRNECLAVDLSLSRRFTSSTSVTPTTDVGLSVQFLGFGGTTRAGPARACRG
jgi:LPS-assembly protein